MSGGPSQTGASSVNLRRCDEPISTAVARPVLAGTKPLQALAIPTRVGCAGCQAFAAGCVTRWLTRPITPIDALGSTVASLRSTPKGRRRLRAELPAAVHRLTAAGEWSTLAALCRRFPLSVAPAVVNTDDWGGESPLGLEALAGLAMSGVLGLGTYDRSWPTAAAGRMTVGDAALAHRLRIYHKWLTGTVGGGQAVAAAIAAATPLPLEVADIVAGPAAPKRRAG
jgi:hypothetical protein